MKYYINEDEFTHFLFLEDFDEEDWKDNTEDNSWYLDDVYDIPDELVNRYNLARQELEECFKQLKEIMY
jgi:hypothetical protein